MNQIKFLAAAEYISGKVKNFFKVSSLSKQKEERASFGCKISQVQITRLDFTRREGTNTKYIPHQNTGLAGDEKVTQQLHKNPLTSQKPFPAHTLQLSYPSGLYKKSKCSTF